MAPLRLRGRKPRPDRSCANDSAGPADGACVCACERFAPPPRGAKPDGRRYRDATLGAPHPSRAPFRTPCRTRSNCPSRSRT
ncbi:hypothetical protein Y027_3015 [Burkholderia pseudomallei TSV5]|nr:hypothetical protein DO70_3254 [Burkholderia pseudomallei]KGX58959.1 hypothetical protein Y027_3015 [Burkholderia pseudomallei TSV5]